MVVAGVLGHLVQQNYRFPGFIDLEGHKFADLPNGFSGLVSVPTLGLVQIFLSIGWWELKGWVSLRNLTWPVLCWPAVAIALSLSLRCPAAAQMAAGGGFHPRRLRHQVPGLHQDRRAEGAEESHRAQQRQVALHCIILHCLSASLIVLLPLLYIPPLPVSRAAQMGLLALLIHEQIDGHPYVINDILGLSYKFN